MHLTMKRKCLLARAFSRSRQCRVRAAGTVGGKAPGGCKAASDEGNYTTKRKCLLARAFSRSRQCRVRAAGTVGGKAPVGCKAASDEGNYTTKRKCVLAQTFSRGRQWHIVRLSAARAAQPPILAAWHHVTIIPRSENVCLHKHFREAVNCAAAHCAEAAKPLDFAFQQNPCAYYTTYSRFFKRCTHILTSSAPHPPNIRPCQPRQTALISSGSSPNYVLLFQRIVPICEYSL